MKKSALDVRNKHHMRHFMVASMFYRTRTNIGAGCFQTNTFEHDTKKGNGNRTT